MIYNISMLISKLFRHFFSLFLVFILFFNHYQLTCATENTDTYEAKVTEIINEVEIIAPHSEIPDTSQQLKLQITNGDRQGENIYLEVVSNAYFESFKYYVDDRVIVANHFDEQENETFYITDYLRRPALIWLLIIFVSLALIVGRSQGLRSIIGLIGSFIIIFSFILPKIATGHNPILMVILGSLLIVPLIFLLSHGFNRQTYVAMTATIITLIITGFIIVLFVNLAKLTGLASEEAGFVKAMSSNLINLKNLLIAGMLIATLGVLDDITIAQAGIVQQLKAANPKFQIKDLYQRAMKIGRDHIASMINTLILVYAGASFPLLLLFLNSQQSLMSTINYEIVADEIVRTLTGSIGLIIAVPLTTILASWLEIELGD